MIGSDARSAFSPVTPYDSWKRTHALHHASSGDLQPARYR